MLLFGSRARGDNERGSDTDLLLVTPAGEPRHRSIGRLSMFFYPWEKLLAEAAEGDLFLYHVTTEAKPIFDPQGYLEKLRAKFTLRRSYAFEVSHASDLGWLLERHADALPSQLVAKRILWCVRTILIARAAERGQPVFGPLELAGQTRSQAASDLLTERHQRRADAPMQRRFRQFLATEANAPPLPQEADLDAFRVLFRNTGNKVGLSTLQEGELALDGIYR
ncbi:nucleotidyltransferase domain-containing protein [Sphingomonas sp. 22176]|uniref:nucleotidyltransferase domain-containing protein n=1 Tax=Sphingomonas sp. 22176 TaxID=3453884 RepID=UPI003F873722